MPKSPEVDGVDHHHLALVQVERVHEMRDIAARCFVDELVDRHGGALGLVVMKGEGEGGAFG